MHVIINTCELFFFIYLPYLFQFMQRDDVFALFFRKIISLFPRKIISFCYCIIWIQYFVVYRTQWFYFQKLANPLLFFVKFKSFFKEKCSIVKMATWEIQFLVKIEAQPNVRSDFRMKKYLKKERLEDLQMAKRKNRRHSKILLEVVFTEKMIANRTGREEK